MSSVEAFIKPHLFASEGDEQCGEEYAKPISVSGNRVRAVPQEWLNSFGHQFYFHKRTFSQIKQQDNNDWKICLEGRLFEAGKKLCITDYEELRSYISQELGGELTGGIADE